MRGRNSGRTVAGRHTLGSLPESQEPQDPATLPPPPAFPPPDNLTDGAEPLRTIYVPTWYEARRRLLVVRDETSGPLADLLDLCETAWHAVRDLQHWAEANEARSNEADAYGCLLSFVDADVVDVFRDLAGGVADLVPGWEGREFEADPEGVAADVDTFMRYLTLLHHAAQAAPVPEPFAVLVASVAERLTGWGEEAAALVAVVWEAREPRAGWDEG
jgi:hypothetical protein